MLAYIQEPELLLQTTSLVCRQCSILASHYTSWGDTRGGVDVTAHVSIVNEGASRHCSTIKQYCCRTADFLNHAFMSIIQTCCMRQSSTSHIFDSDF